MSENKLNSDSEEAKNDKDHPDKEDNDSKSELTPSESSSHKESKEDLPGEDKSSVVSNDIREITAGNESSDSTSENHRLTSRNLCLRILILLLPVKKLKMKKTARIPELQK